MASAGNSLTPPIFSDITFIIGGSFNTDVEYDLLSIKAAPYADCGATTTVCLVDGFDNPVLASVTGTKLVVHFDSLKVAT